MSSIAPARPAPHRRAGRTTYPAPPQPAYFQFAVSSLPADGAELSGDFLDVFPTRNDHWIAVLGDVCGKGAAAAAVAEQVRAVIRRAAALNDRPRQILSALNHLLTVDDVTVTSRFLTMVCLLLRPAASGVEVVLCSAGHPPGLLRGPDGRVGPVGDGGGAMLGVLSEPRLVETRLLLGPDDTLLLYTDGVTEARCGNEEYAGRLSHLLARMGGIEVALVPGHVQQAALAFGGGVNRDDVAVMALRAGRPAA